MVARIGVPQGSARQDRSFLTAIGHAANIVCRLQEQADTNQIWVGDALRLRAPQDWQRFFNRVFPTEWTWISYGTTNLYPAWHFDAVLPEIQRLPFASTILTGLRPLPSAGLLLPPPSNPSNLTPQNSILAALLKGKRLSDSPAQSRRKTTGLGIFSAAPFKNFSDNPPSRNGIEWLIPIHPLTRHASHTLPLTLTDISLTSDYEKAHDGVHYS